jgi:hypothetical protein
LTRAAQIDDSKISPDDLPNVITPQFPPNIARVTLLAPPGEIHVTRHPALSSAQQAISACGVRAGSANVKNRSDGIFT